MRQWQALQLQSLERLRRSNQRRYGKEFRRLNQRMQRLIRDKYKSGETHQERVILDALQRGADLERGDDAVSAAFFRANQRKLDALIDATTHDMTEAETAILRKQEDVYRKAIYNAQVYVNTGAATYEKAVQMAVADFAKNGLACVVYRNGAVHKLEDYADMALKTAAKRAYLYGEGTKRQEWGQHLVKLNKRGGACPKCAPFCGKVYIDDVWSGGTAEDGDYPLMSEAIKQGLYHPRCKDVHTTYFPDLGMEDGWDEETEPTQDQQMRIAGWGKKENNSKAIQTKNQTGVDHTENNDTIKLLQESVYDANRSNGCLVFETGEAVNDFFYYDDDERGYCARKKSKYGQWFGLLTPEEKDALLWYAGNGYRDINCYLRKTDGWERIDPKITDEINLIDSAIARFELKDSIIVHRGVGDIYPSSIVELDGWDYMEELIGKTFYDLGFGSSTALHGSPVAKSQPFLYEIEIPAGIGRGAYINMNAGQYEDAECEFLLARNSQFVITDVIHNTEAIPEQFIIKMRMIVDG